MAFILGANIALDGEKEFKQAVSSVNKDLAVLSSEMGLVTAQYGKNADSMKGLTAQQTTLSKSVDKQAEKVEILKAALDKSAKAVNENGERTAALENKTKAWQISLNKAQADLVKTQQQLVTVNESLENFSESTSDASGEMENFGEEAEEAGKEAKQAAEEASPSVWSKIAAGIKQAAGAMGTVAEVTAKAVAGLGAVGAAAVAAMTAVTVSAANAAKELTVLSQTTGLSTQTLQKYQYAAEQLGVSMSTLTSASSALTKSMDSARNGSASYLAAFESLGVATTDVNGNLRDSNEVFNEVIDALGKVGNATERDALSMQIFGGSAASLNPLILAGADAFKALGNEAEAAGLVLSDQALGSLTDFSNSMTKLKSVVGGVGNLLGSVFAPQLTEVSDALTGSLSKLTGAFAEGGFEGLTEVAGEVIGELVDMLVTKIPEIIDFGLTIVESLIQGIVNALPQLVNGVLQIVNMLVNTLTRFLPTIVKAGVNLIVTLAKGIAEALPTIVNAAIDVVFTVIDTILDNLGEVIDAAIDIVMAIVQGITEGLPRLVDKVPEIILKIVETLTANLPKILEAAVTIIFSLAQGIVSAIPKLLARIPEIIQAIVKGLIDGIGSIFLVGVDLVKGLWEGISSAVGWLWNNITGWLGGVVDGIKGFFGIHSPSRVFAGIGENLAAGLGEGFEDEMSKVTKQMNESVPTSFDTTANIASQVGAGLVNGMNGNTVHIHLDLGDRQIAEVVYDLLPGIAKQRGEAWIS